jgi:hypothetical protein
VIKFKTKWVRSTHQADNSNAAALCREGPKILRNAKGATIRKDHCAFDDLNRQYHCRLLII